MAMQNTFGEVLELHPDTILDGHIKSLASRAMIGNYLTAENLAGQPADGRRKRFLYVTMVPYCRDEQVMIPAEISMVVFSVLEGVVDKLTALIDPGDIPQGGRGEVIIVCDRNGLPLPGQFQECNATAMKPEHLLTEMHKFAEKYGLFTEGKVLIFGMRSELTVLEKCMIWLVRQGNCPVPVESCVIMCFETLCYQISRVDSDSADSKYTLQHEGGAGKFIYKSRYDFYESIACEWHSKDGTKEETKVDRCALNIALRHVYNILMYFYHLSQSVIEEKQKKLLEDGEKRIPRPINSLFPFKDELLVEATRKMHIRVVDNRVNVSKPKKK